MPTDSRYQSLNLFQKLILLYTIDNDLYEKLELTKTFVDQIKFYINPEFYKLEHGDQKDEYSRKNIESERQKATGRATGIPKSSKMLREEIDNFYKQIDIDKKEVITEKKEEDEVLG